MTLGLAIARWRICYYAFDTREKECAVCREAILAVVDELRPKVCRSTVNGYTWKAWANGQRFENGQVPEEDLIEYVPPVGLEPTPDAV